MSDVKVTGRRTSSSEPDGKTEVKNQRSRSDSCVHLQESKSSGFDDQGSENSITVKDLRTLIKNAKRNVPSIKLRAIQNARELLSGQNPPVDQLINSEILPILVKCLREHSYPKIQLEATYALIYIVKGSSQQVRAVVTAGAVPYLMDLLSSKVAGLNIKAICALGNIVDVGPEFRDLVLSLDLMPKLLALIQTPFIPLTFLRDISWFIANTCRLKDSSPNSKATVEMLSAVNYLIYNKDVIVLSNTLLAIYYISFGGYSQIQKILDSGLLPIMIPLLSHNDIDIRTTAISVVGMILVGTDEQKQVVIDAGVLRYVSVLFNHSDRKVHKDAVRIVSNLLAGNKVQIQAVIDAGLIPGVIRHLSKSEFRTQKDTVLGIHELVLRGSRQQVDYVINAGVVASLCALLSCPDIKVIILILDSLLSMLKMSWPDVELLTDWIEDCGGLEQIEKLQDHENFEIYKISYDMIKRFFSEESA